MQRQTDLSVSALDDGWYECHIENIFSNENTPDFSPGIRTLLVRHRHIYGNDVPSENGAKECYDNDISRERLFVTQAVMSSEKLPEIKKKYGQDLFSSPTQILTENSFNFLRFSSSSETKLTLDEKDRKIVAICDVPEVTCSIVNAGIAQGDYTQGTESVSKGAIYLPGKIQFQYEWNDQKNDFVISHIRTNNLNLMKLLLGDFKEFQSGISTQQKIDLIQAEQLALTPQSTEWKEKKTNIGNLEKALKTSAEPQIIGLIKTLSKDDICKNLSLGLSQNEHIDSTSDLLPSNAKKQEWKLAFLRDLYETLTNPAEMLRAFVSRESIKNFNSQNMTISNLSLALSAINNEDSKSAYQIHDPNRVFSMLNDGIDGVGFSRDELSSISTINKLKLSAAIQYTIANQAQNKNAPSAVFYFQKLSKLSGNQTTESESSARAIIDDQINFQRELAELAKPVVEAFLSNSIEPSENNIDLVFEKLNEEQLNQVGLSLKKILYLQALRKLVNECTENNTVNDSITAAATEAFDKILSDINVNPSPHLDTYFEGLVTRKIDNGTPDPIKTLIYLQALRKLVSECKENNAVNDSITDAATEAFDKILSDIDTNPCLHWDTYFEDLVTQKFDAYTPDPIKTLICLQALRSLEKTCCPDSDDNNPVTNLAKTACKNFYISGIKEEIQSKKIASEDWASVTENINCANTLISATKTSNSIHPALSAFIKSSQKAIELNKSWSRAVKPGMAILAGIGIMAVAGTLIGLTFGFGAIAVGAGIAILALASTAGLVGLSLSGLGSAKMFKEVKGKVYRGVNKLESAAKKATPRRTSQ